MGTQQDTHKMHSRRGMFIGAFVIAIIVTLLGLVRFFPVDESNIMMQSAYAALAEMALGVINFFLLSISHFEPPVYYVLYVAILLVSGFIYGLIIVALGSRGLLGRIMVLVIIVLNTCPGMFSVSFGNTSVGPPYASCEKYLSDEVGIRIKAYPEGGVIPGAHFFFMETRDGGVTWKEIMHFRHDDQLEPPCENIKYRTPDHYWVWMGWQMTVTNDGGQTWHEWEPWDTWPDFKYTNYRMISNVDFEDELRGSMQLRSRPAHNLPPELATFDGGITWIEP